MKAEKPNLILKLLALPVIAFNPIFKDITGNTNAALLLSQILYWANKMKYKEFYKTDKELMDETRLTKNEITQAKKCLTKLKIVRIVKKGIPCKTFYTLDIDRLNQMIEKALKINSCLESRKLVSCKPGNLSPENQATITEDYAKDYTKNLSPKRETQNFGKEKENLLCDLSKHIEPKRLERIEKLPLKQLDILLFLLEKGRINLNQIQDLYAYAKSLNEPEDFIPYAERCRTEQQLKKMKEEERRRRSEPPQDALSREEARHMIRIISAKL